MLLALALIFTAARASAQPTIIDLGLPGATHSWGTAVSADGAAVAGYSQVGNEIRGFRWTISGGTEDVGQVLIGGQVGFGVNRLAISADGSVVVGTGMTAANGPQAFRWTTAGGREFLGGIPFSGTSLKHSYGYAVSASGSAVTGYSTGTSPFGPYSRTPAVRWTSASGFEDLGFMPGYTPGINDSTAFCVGTGVSADGSILAGVGTLPSNAQRAFRWSSAMGLQDLGALSGDTHSRALAISADGSVVTGSSFGSLFRAFRWTVDGGMEDLGVPAGASQAYAQAISGNGWVVGGICTPGLSPSGSTAFLWSRRTGMFYLHPLLQSLGTDLTGWQLWEVNGLSADGSAIIGNGSLNGQLRAFLITGFSRCHTACLADFDCNGTVDVVDLFGFLDAWFAQTGVCASNCTADFDGNNTVDVVDLFDFLDAWFAQNGVCG